MRRWHIVLLALATGIVLLTSVATAHPSAMKQRVPTTAKGTAHMASVRDVLFGTVKPFVRGTQWQRVDGIRFSFKVPRAHPPSPVPWPWQNGPAECTRPSTRVRRLFISKSTVGGQRAEAVIFWTSFPAGGEAAPCIEVVSLAIGRSTAALARAMARAPGTKLVEGPTRVTVGGRPARRVVVKVRRDLGCDPGFFFSWRPRAPDGECWGTCWLEANVGDKITVWIVAVDGKRLVIEAVTEQPESHIDPRAIPVTRADVLKVEAEMEKIVGSIRFG